MSCGMPAFISKKSQDYTGKVHLPNKIFRKVIKIKKTYLRRLSELSFTAPNLARLKMFWAIRIFKELFSDH